MVVNEKEKPKSRIVVAAALVLGSALMTAEPASAAWGCGPGAWRGPWGTAAIRRITVGCRTAVGSKRALIDDVVVSSATPSVD
jgi:hypothetical protein